VEFFFPEKRKRESTIFFFFTKQKMSGQKKFYVFRGKKTLYLRML